MRALLRLALTMACAAGCSSARKAPATCDLAGKQEDWRLHADGTRLRDAAGREVTLRGVNAGGRSKFDPYVPFDFQAGGYQAALDAYLDRAADWGVDVLRVPFTWAAVEPMPGQDDAAYLARLDALIDGAWARDMRVVLDMHQDLYAENYCGDGFPEWTLPEANHGGGGDTMPTAARVGPLPQQHGSDDVPKPHHDCPQWYLLYQSPAVMAAFDAFWRDGSMVQAAFASLWERMATRYGERPGVIGFEILNEPSSGSAPEPTFEATTLTAFYTRLAARIHAAAPNALVFFGVPGIDGALVHTTLGRPSGDGLVFAPHYYQTFDAVGDPTQVASAIGRWRDLAVSWSLPLFVGEFGVDDSSPMALATMDAHYAAFDALGVSGTQWDYSVSSQDWNDEHYSLVSATGTEQPLVSALARPHALAVAGTAVSASYDIDSRTYVLRYRAGQSDGITEVVLPKRAWPEQVELDGGCVDLSRSDRLFVRAPASTPVTLRIAPR